MPRTEKDFALVPRSLRIPHISDGVSAGWRDVMRWMAPFFANNRHADPKLIKRFLLCYGFEGKATNEVARAAEEYVISWHFMLWKAQQIVKLGVSARFTSLRIADPYCSVHYPSFAGCSDGYIYHLIEDRKKLKLHFRRTVSARLSRLESYKREVILFGHNKPIPHAMAIAFDRRQRLLLLVEQHDNRASPKAIHIFRLDDIDHHSELRSRYTLRWPVEDAYNHPISIRMQAAGGFAAILVMYDQRKGNHLVIAEYVSPVKPAWAWKHDGVPWAPISYVFRDEQNMLILERNPDYKARDQLRLYNYHFATPHPRKTPLPVPKLIAGCMWNSSGNPASLVEFVPQISVPISSDSPIIDRVDRGEVGDFWNNISAVPIGIKFNANGLYPDTYVCHQGDLIDGNWKHTQIFKAIEAGEQHAMNGMKLISWRSFDTTTEIRVEDFTDGLWQSEFLEATDSSGVLATSADANWTTNTVRGTQSVRSVTTIRGGGMESMDVTEDGIVFWRRAPVFCELGGQVRDVEYIHAHMYGL